MVSVILLINGSVLILEIVCKRVSLTATSHLNRTYPVVSRRERFCGVFLFLLYINDLPNCLMHSQPRMYADDTSITYASNDVEEIERCVNIDLDRIRIWLAANKLTLNTTKTEFLLIGSRQRLSTLERNPIIEINQFPIKHVSTSKIFLGSVILTNL